MMSSILQVCFIEWKDAENAKSVCLIIMNEKIWSKSVEKDVENEYSH